jgi:hypothetical protein
MPGLNYPLLWYHDVQKALYQGFGGQLSDYARHTSSRSRSLWRLQLNDAVAVAAATNLSWTTVLDERHRSLAELTPPVGGLSAYSGDSAYVLGGVSGVDDSTAEASASAVLPGLVHYNMSSGALRNESATAYHGTGSAQYGQMVHVPAYGGARGVFVVLGGYSAPLAGFEPGRGHLSFMNVTLYDPHTRRWHWQTADGVVPRPREEFCAVGAQSTNGTYEMYKSPLCFLLFLLYYSKCLCRGSQFLKPAGRCPWLAH